jgi:tetratricopeptide (TPR) repeat protein
MNAFNALKSIQTILVFDTSHFIRSHDKRTQQGERDSLAAEIEERTQFDWFSVARIHEEEGQYNEALMAYEESVKLAPKYAKAWFHKAKLHYKLGQTEKAKECVKRILELEPDWKKYIEKYLPDL